MPKEIAPNGARLSPPGGWAKHTAAVEEAVRNAPKPRGRGSVSNLQPGRAYLLKQAPRCTCIANRTGQRCQQRAVRGSSRCYVHNGLLDVPAHPSNRKRLGELHDKLAGIDARKAFYAYDIETRTNVHQAYQRATENAKRPRRSRWINLLAGAQAITADQPAKAFQAWLKSLMLQERD